MTAVSKPENEPFHPKPVRYDAVVVGAGFSGLRMLHELRELGMTAIVVEDADDVGGTWWWNRYPGARTDSESWYYCYSFSDKILAEWDWSERFSTQGDVLRYLQFVADRLDLRKDILLKTRVDSAVYDEVDNNWVVSTNRGHEFEAKFFISAMGSLSKPFLPNFKGAEKFQGHTLMPSRWPDEDIDFTGKRVAVVGTGATGIQLIPIVAETAAQVTVFQRTPNYVLPARSYTLTSHHMQGIRSRYGDIWDLAYKQAFGFGIETIDRPMSMHSEEEINAILQGGWETGGFRFLFHTFSDIFVNEETNEVVAKFFRNKVRELVHDPVTAEKLCPRGYPIGGKRPPLGHYYYETFNRVNVRLIDVNEEPIHEITPTGIRAGDEDHDFDIIIYATGFDAGTGALTAIDIRGRDGVTLADTWSDGPRTYLGLTVSGFPNFFMLYGPQSVFANVPVVVELSVNWISKVLQWMKTKRVDRIEPTPESEVAYNERLMEILHQTVIPKGEAAGSWFFGSNVPGKPTGPLFEFSGVEAYTALITQVVDDDLEGFAKSTTTAAAL